MISGFKRGGVFQALKKIFLQRIKAADCYQNKIRWQLSSVGIFVWLRLIRFMDNEEIKATV